MGCVDTVLVIACNMLLDIQARRSDPYSWMGKEERRQEQIGTSRSLFQPRDWPARATLCSTRRVRVAAGYSRTSI
jgi:hypothetical protein